MNKKRHTYSLKIRSSNVLACIMIILIVTIFSTNNSQGWKRIEGDKIRIEKGDNLWRISHSLLGSGWRYMEIWQGEKDGYKTNDPNLIYPGMVFSYRYEKPIPDTVSNGSYDILNDINSKMDTTIRLIDTVKNVLRKSTHLEGDKLFELFIGALLALGSGIIATLVANGILS